MNPLPMNPGISSGAPANVSVLLLLVALLSGCSAIASPVFEEVTGEDYETLESFEPYTAKELEDLVAPIALYPDDLLAIVLPASTYPLQIVQAARYLQAREFDSTLEPDEDWDNSIVALLNYPEALAFLNEDLDWTWALGDAVISQETDLINAVSDFRERARIAGNLESDEHQHVTLGDEGFVQITPAVPEEIYVPYYEPAQVVVHQPLRVYHYYPRAYPLYYYPYPSNHRFSGGSFWGVTSAFSIGWTTKNLHVHHNDRNHRGNEWSHDGNRAGSRPQHKWDRRNQHRDQHQDQRHHDKQVKYRSDDHVALRQPHAERGHKIPKPEWVSGTTVRTRAGVDRRDRARPQKQAEKSRARLRLSDQMTIEKAHKKNKPQRKTRERTPSVAIRNPADRPANRIVSVHKVTPKRSVIVRSHEQHAKSAAKRQPVNRVAMPHKRAEPAPRKVASRAEVRKLKKSDRQRLAGGDRSKRVH